MLILFYMTFTVFYFCDSIFIYHSIFISITILYSLIDIVSIIVVIFPSNHSSFSFSSCFFLFFCSLFWCFLFEFYVLDLHLFCMFSYPVLVAYILRFLSRLFLPHPPLCSFISCFIFYCIFQRRKSNTHENIPFIFRTR